MTHSPSQLCRFSWCPQSQSAHIWSIAGALGGVRSRSRRGLAGASSTVPPFSLRCYLQLGLFPQLTLALLPMGNLHFHMDPNPETTDFQLWPSQASPAHMHTPPRVSPPQW